MPLGEESAFHFGGQATMNRKPALSDCSLPVGLQSASGFSGRHFGHHLSLMFLNLIDYSLVGTAECRLRCGVLTHNGGLGRFCDMNGRPSKVVSLFAQKRKRQAAWNKLCEEDSGRSPEH